jgi:hypothetical protein
MNTHQAPAGKTIPRVQMIPALGVHALSTGNATTDQPRKRMARRTRLYTRGRLNEYLEMSQIRGLEKNKNALFDVAVVYSLLSNKRVECTLRFTQTRAHT